MASRVLSAFRISVLFLNFCLYAWLAWLGIDRFLNPRVEILSGRPYMGPTSHEVFGAVTNATAAIVLVFTLLYLIIRQNSLIGPIAVAISCNAAVSLYGYVELCRYGVTFEQSPIDYVGPLIGVALAAANVLMYRAGASRAGA